MPEGENVNGETGHPDRLEREAQLLLGTKVFDEIKQWYYETLKDTWTYVVFIVRRSYLLALIMEKITGKKMEEQGKATFLTDASLLLSCGKLAEYYKMTGEFPKILICDDILIHGRNINHLLSQLEKQLILLLSDVDEEKIKTALSSAIKIHVYMRADTQLLLNNRYEFNLHYIRKEEQSVWRVLGSSISILILRSNMANASYIFSEYLTNQEFERIEKEKYTRTIYQGTEEYTYVQLIGDMPEKEAIFTIRIIKGYGNDGYRVVPFVFLPNLTGEITRDLLENVLQRIDNQDYRKWFELLDAIWGKRSFNELLTLIFSNVILQAFNLKYGFQINQQEKEEELLKLARNYNLFGLKKTQMLLRDLIDMELFSIEELHDLLCQFITEEFMVVRIESDGQHSDKEIREKLESYFYERGYNEEREALELVKNFYFDTTKHSIRRARGCCFTLTDLCSDYSEADVKVAMAYFLQMMDAGILGLSSYAPDNVRVVGMAQYSKAGELALYLFPLKDYKYIPLLARMQYESDQWHITLREEIEKYWDKLGLPIKDKIIEFVEKLEKIGQTPADWKGNYFSRIDLGGNNSDEEFSYKMQFIRQQQEILDRYIALKR